jgi:molybdopterin converting factor small subunit
MNPFDSFAQFNAPDPWQLTTLSPTPEEEWRRMRDFLGLNREEIQAMLATVETLFKRGHELVVATYDYLLQNPETSAILGWEQGADPTHLAERRRFFTVWLARLLGMDFSDDLARYLFRAGQFHAGHGPRQIHVPPVYVTGSTSLVNATFARFLTEEMAGNPVVPTALAGWNKALTLHLHMMHLGYQVALELGAGDLAVPVNLYGKMRTLTGRHALTVHLREGAALSEALRKFFNYFPAARQDVFDLTWTDGERLDATGTPWFEARPVHRVKPMWRVLLNGKDVSFLGGPEIPVRPGDEISVFPPGR